MGYVLGGLVSRFVEQVKKLGGSVRKCGGRHLPSMANVEASRTSSCGDMSLALLPFDGGHALVCANCDHADEFPRVKAV